MTDLAWTDVPGDEPPVVLLHEGAGSRAVWARAQQSLRNGRQAISYDRRGYGDSPRNVSLGADHFDQAVTDLVALLRELETAPADLVGHSDGGSVALLTAARHPQLVRSVTAVATHVYADDVTRSAVRQLGSVDAWDEQVRDFYARQHGEDWAEVVDGWSAMWTDGGLAGWDMRDELPRIRCPVLVVHDRADPLSPPEHAQLIERGAPRARVSWYETANHRPHLVEPDRFNAQLEQFFSALS